MTDTPSPSPSSEIEIAALTAQLNYFESMFERTRMRLGSEVREGLPVPRLEVELIEELDGSSFIWRYSLVLGKSERLSRSVTLEITEQTLSPSNAVAGRDPSTHIPHQIPWRSDADELGIPVVLVVGDTTTLLTARGDA